MSRPSRRRGWRAACVRRWWPTGPRLARTALRVGHELARRAGSLGHESLFVESGVCRRCNTGESGSPTRRRRPRIGGLERVLVRARSLRRASVAPHGRGTRPEQPDDRARCFCVSWLINISLARTPAFRGKMSRLLSAFFYARREGPRRLSPEP